MENRFGFRDLVLVVFLIAILVSIWIAMNQFDRQFKLILNIQEQLQQQTASQARMERSIGNLHGLFKTGVVVPSTSSGSKTTTSTKGSLPFLRIQMARETENFAEGDWLVDAFASVPTSLTPLVSKDLYGRRIQNFILQPLIARDPDTLEFVGVIASSWDVAENRASWQDYVDQRLAEPVTDQEILSEKGYVSADSDKAKKDYLKSRLIEGRRVSEIINEPDCPAAIIVTFELRRDVVFSDGEPLTAEDVVFTFDLMNNPLVDCPAERNFYDNIRKCSADGAYRVIFELKEPHYLAMSMAGGRPILPKHFYNKFSPQELNKSTGLLLGSGPYRMSTSIGWKPGEPIELVRNERFWGPSTAFDRLVWRIVNEDVARMTLFRNGDLDLFSATPEQYDELLKDAVAVDRTQQLAINQVPSGYAFIAWNQRRGGDPTLFADKRVRQAMTYLSDRQRLSEEVLLGYATPANGPFEPGSVQRNPNVSTRPYDLEKGKALLADVGWKDRDGDGVLENTEGHPFRFTFMYPQGNSLYDRIVLFLKDSYARAGIEMVPDKLEWAVFVDRLDNRNFDAATLRWGGGAIESDIRQMFHSSQISGAANNFQSYSNPALDRLIDEARMTLDDAKRFELWQQCHSILWEDQPYTFMFTQKALRFIDSRIHNIRLVTSGLNTREEWFVPAAMQKWSE